MTGQFFCTNIVSEKERGWTVFPGRYRNGPLLCLEGEQYRIRYMGGLERYGLLPDYTFFCKEVYLPFFLTGFISLAKKILTESVISSSRVR